MRNECEYITCCVDQLNGHLIQEMMDTALRITFRTFCNHVNITQVQEDFGYGRGMGLYLRNDWHVEYYRSKWRGKRCYVMKHSAIEYIFQAKE